MKATFIKEYNAGGIKFRPGDLCPFDEKSLQYLVKRGYVKVNLFPDDEPKRREYKRRDMKAQS
jgi:hypothetical protein